MLLQYFLIFLMLVASSGAGELHRPAAPPLSKSTAPVVEKSARVLPAAPILLREKYTIDAVIDYDRHNVTVEETILYPNHTGRQLDSLTLAIAANLWPDCFSLTAISVNGAPIAEYKLKAHRLEIPLPTPLAPDSVSTVGIRYTLSLPFMDQTSSLRARGFGYSNLQMNLVNWYPFIVPNINGEWVIHEPWSHGEYLVYPLADFEVNVIFSRQQNVPVVAASGEAEQIGQFTRYTLKQGRAFALAASRDFQVSQMKVGDITVYSYYLPIYKRAAEAALFASAQAIQVYSQKFGAYPHKTLSVVLADSSEGMEFSALYFHSRKFYDLYDGRPANYLTFVAVHETAHQWWFEQVGSDPALEPWLDESLATYSESIYYESAHPELLSYWWSNRIDFFTPGGYIDIPVNGAENGDAYKQAVYFNGARFLRNLRARIGERAFFAFIQDYFAQYRGKIATTGDFFRVLDAHTDVDYSDIVRAYFRSQ